MRAEEFIIEAYERIRLSPINPLVDSKDPVRIRDKDPDIQIVILNHYYFRAHQREDPEYIKKTIYRDNVPTNLKITDNMISKLFQREKIIRANVEEGQEFAVYSTSAGISIGCKRNGDFPDGRMQVTVHTTYGGRTKRWYEISVL